MKREQSMSEEKESKTEKSSRPTAFSLRTLLLLVLIFALAMGWALDRAKMKSASESSEYDIQGPLFVQYTVRKSSNSTAGSKISGALGIDFRGGNTIVHTRQGGTVLSSASLVDCVWIFDN